MSRPARVAVAFGTRPEASKMAPVVQALEAHGELAPWILLTGQHRDQLDAMMQLFGLRADADLDVMVEGQTLPGLLAKIVPAAAEALRRAEPAYCLVHGDTLTSFAVALAAFYEEIPVGHVEAGLRSFDLRQPFPEEANRRLTDTLTDVALAPTAGARANLLREGVCEERIVVTGNTAVDAVRQVAARAAPPAVAPAAEPRVVITLHRRENLPVLRGLAEALAHVARAFPDHAFVYPVHPNPAVRRAVQPPLAGVPNVHLTEPQGYGAMVALLATARLIVTDSGGLQEEGAALRVPVAVVRNVTERPEGVEAGALVLIGNDPDTVGERLTRLLADEAALRVMRAARNPYGDGHAGPRVAAAVAWRLGLGPRPDPWRDDPGGA
ncbi:MAG: UDP-N-acetylglucosamine 2-epimerase (non-hydrolyzing) [Trueperaceae bacterium]|nr:UDP-N-acetylglucosamine 2-epimerase (non-hydrolyzing) [Trueperaceae bacterium]